MARVFISQVKEEFDIIEELKAAIEEEADRSWKEEFVRARGKIRQIIKQIEKATEVMIDEHIEAQADLVRKYGELG